MALLKFNTETRNLSDEECLKKLGFIPDYPIRVVGDFLHLKPDINKYGYFYGQIVIVTDKEHTKLCRRFKQWGGKEFQQINKEQFLREYGTLGSSKS